PGPRYAEPGRALRGRPAAHPDRRGAPARCRRCPRRRGDRHHRPAAPATARPAPPTRRRLPRPAPGMNAMSLRYLLAACLVPLLLAGCQRGDAPDSAEGAQPADSASPGTVADQAAAAGADRPGLVVTTLDGERFD